MPTTQQPADATPYGVYICPQTRATLELGQGILRAEGGGLTYELCDGIPNFLRYDAAETEETSAELERLNRLAKAQGWRKALQEVFGEDSRMYRYVTSERRASFLDLLALTDEAITLEIGPGLGQFTPSIARRVKTVYALEVVRGQAEFTAERTRQEGQSNVRVACGGDDCRLPYEDSTFDVVVLNLVLEWCASRNADEPPSVGQRRMLSEIHRVLKGGGSLYLATKNRYALTYLTGKPDEHAYSMRFGNAQPRWLLNLLLRLKGRAGVRGLLHSHNELKNMLLEAGFQEARSFWAAPEMRYPDHYIPTDAAGVRAARGIPNFVQGEMRRTKLLMPLIPASLVKHFTPGLAFVAKKANCSPR